MWQVLNQFGVFLLDTSLDHWIAKCGKLERHGWWINFLECDLVASIIWFSLFFWFLKDWSTKCPRQKKHSCIINFLIINRLKVLVPSHVCCCASFPHIEQENSVDWRDIIGLSYFWVADASMTGTSLNVTCWDKFLMGSWNIISRIVNGIADYDFKRPLIRDCNWHITFCCWVPLYHCVYLFYVWRCWILELSAFEFGPLIFPTTFKTVLVNRSSFVIRPVHFDISQDERTASQAVDTVLEANWDSFVLTLKTLFDDFSSFFPCNEKYTTMQLMVLCQFLWILLHIWSWLFASRFLSWGKLRKSTSFTASQLWN